LTIPFYIYKKKNLSRFSTQKKNISLANIARFRAMDSIGEKRLQEATWLIGISNNSALRGSAS
jgi:hypothetical protein